MSAANNSTAPTTTPAPSDAFYKHVSFTSDEIKYKKKYGELKRKLGDLEEENDKMLIRLTRARKAAERLRIERNFLHQQVQSSCSVLFEPDSPSSGSGDEASISSDGGGGGGLADGMLKAGGDAGEDRYFGGSSTGLQAFVMEKRDALSVLGYPESQIRQVASFLYQALPAELKQDFEEKSKKSRRRRRGSIQGGEGKSRKRKEKALITPTPPTGVAVSSAIIDSVVVESGGVVGGIVGVEEGTDSQDLLFPIFTESTTALPPSTKPPATGIVEEEEEEEEEEGSDLPEDISVMSSESEE